MTYSKMRAFCCATFALSGVISTSDAAVITYSVTTNNNTSNAYTSLDSAFNQNNVIDSGNTESTYGNSNSYSDVYGDEKLKSFVSGPAQSTTEFLFSSELIAEASSHANTLISNREDGSITASLSGNSSASRIDADIVRTDIRISETADGTNYSITKTTQPYLSRAYSHASSTIRIDASENGVESNTATNFIIHSRVGDNAVIGDSSGNQNYLDIRGDKLQYSGTQTSLDTGEVIERGAGVGSNHLGTVSASRSATLDESGNYSLPGYSYSLSGTFEGWIRVQNTVRSELAFQSDNDGGIETKYDAQQSYYTNLIIGEGSSQFNPIMPDFADDVLATYTFLGGQSGAWFDPLVMENYFFSMDTAGSAFTDILSFPDGFGSTFGLYAFDNSNNIFNLGAFNFTDSVSFETLLSGFSITGFLVTGIEDNSDVHQFPIQLAFTTALADFTMQGIADAEAFLASFNAQDDNDSASPVTSPSIFGLFILSFLGIALRVRKSH